MEFKVISVEEFNKDHGTSWKMPESNYQGEVSDLVVGVTPEVRMKDGTLNTESTTFVRSLDELNDEFWRWHRNEVSHRYEWTGRLVFRGYYAEVYDSSERDYYYVESKVSV